MEQTTVTLKSILDQLPSFLQIKTTQQDYQLIDKFPHIEVTVEEIFEQIQKIKFKKDYSLRMAKLDQSFSNWTAKEYYTKSVERLNELVKAKTNNPDAVYLIEDGLNYEILCFMCYYFANEQNNIRQLGEACNTFYNVPTVKLSTNKGILIMGNTGRGKTLLMKAFAQNPRISYIVVNAKTIRDNFKNKELSQKSCGVESTNYYAGDFKSLGSSMFNQKKYDLCIDDFGAEEMVNLYGNKEEPVLDVLMKRLEEGLITHITTNLTFEEMEKRYGSRLVSRLNEQMNILFFSADSVDFRTK